MVALLSTRMTLRLPVILPAWARPAIVVGPWFTPPMLLIRPMISEWIQKTQMDSGKRARPGRCRGRSQKKDFDHRHEHCLLSSFHPTTCEFLCKALVAVNNMSWGGDR